MSDVYFDIRVKIHTPRNKRDNVICSHDLEDALAIGDAICQEIRELKGYSDVYDVSLMRVGKANNINISIADDFLVDD